MDGKLPKNLAETALTPEAVSILQSTFDASGNGGNAVAEQPGEGLPKTASFKFMITLQDERDLGDLGYSRQQIEKLKPQEAGEIIKAGTRALQD
jgi:hypothetical protein